MLTENELHYSWEANGYIPKAIKEGLLEMELYGYDFWYSSSKDLWKKIIKAKKKKGKKKKEKDHMTMKRICYLKMKCKNCMG